MSQISDYGGVLILRVIQQPFVKYCPIMFLFTKELEMAHKIKKYKIR